jgi:hypothetical protein
MDPFFLPESVYMLLTQSQKFGPYFTAYIYHNPLNFNDSKLIINKT